jgi:hypothetical protein
MRSVTATCAIVRDLVRIALELAVVAGLALCLGLTGTATGAAHLGAEAGSSSAMQSLESPAGTSLDRVASPNPIDSAKKHADARGSKDAPYLVSLKRPGKTAAGG